tara:strand:+ start:4634 stop:5140 length:507 start_codon:yes stop_codon:yes gene_type:complete
MNDELINDLAHVINEEVRTFHSLLDVLRSEQRAIVEDDIEEIERCVEAQREVAVVAHELESKRVHVVERIAEQSDIGDGNMSLGRLVKALEGPKVEELAQMRQKLLQLNEKIRSVSANNAFLIRQSLRYTERCLDIITGQSGAQRGVYGQFGKVRRDSSARSFLNKTA